MLLKWALAMNSEWGRTTWALPIPASPIPFIARWETSLGKPPRFVLPIKRIESFGAKLRAAQSAAWKRGATVTGLSSASETKSRPEPRTVEAVEVGVQSVGLRANSGRLT